MKAARYAKLPLDQRTRLTLVQAENPHLRPGMDWLRLTWPVVLAGCGLFWAVVAHWLGWL